MAVLFMGHKLGIQKQETRKQRTEVGANSETRSG
jgi:hypothetical protein